MSNLEHTLKNLYETAEHSQYNFYFLLVIGSLTFLLIANNQTAKTKAMLNAWILLVELIETFMFLIFNFFLNKGAETSSSNIYQFFFILEFILLFYFSLSFIFDSYFSRLVVDHKRGLNVLFTFLFQLFSLITEFLIKSEGSLNIYTCILIFILKFISLQFSYLRSSVI